MLNERHDGAGIDDGFSARDRARPPPGNASAAVRATPALVEVRSAGSDQGPREIPRDSGPRFETRWGGFVARARHALERQSPILGVMFLVHCALVVLCGLSLIGAAWSLASLCAALIFMPHSFAAAPAALPAAPVEPVRSRDDTETAAAHRPAILSEGFWQGVMQAMPDPAILLNRSGSAVAFNDAAVAVFPGLRTGHHLSSVVRHPDLLDGVARAAATGKPAVVTFSLRLPVERRIRATIADLWQTGRSGPALDGPATSVALPAQAMVQPPDLLLLSLRDLTEQDRVYEMRADFIANASHELRTPLTSMLGFIETLKGSAKNDPQARERFLGIMQVQAERMTRLIDDLLTLSRIEMNAHVRPDGLVEIDGLVGHVVDTLETIAQVNGVTLTVEPLDQPALVRGERDELVQVFQNLVHNAIKYGRDGGHVTIRTVRIAQDIHEADDNAAERRPTRILIDVIDDGPGIAPIHLPRLTERFYRVDEGQSRKRGGTGLGLAIVKHVVNRHRGELRIRSRLGAGSTFSVILTEVAHSPSLPERSGGV